MNSNLNEYIEYFHSIVPYDNFKRLGKVFETKENLYYYDAGTGKVFMCSKEEYEVFKCLTEQGTVSSLNELTMGQEALLPVLETIKQMIEEENIFKMPMYEKFEPSSKEMIQEMVSGSLRQLILEVTESCNLRCKYCIYQTTSEGFRDFSSSKMTWEIAQKAIDYAFAHSGEKLAITFYGGEPLMNYELVKQCIDYSRQFEREKEEVTYSFTTNLTLMTKERAEYFASIGTCSIMGSLDGPKEIHNQFRVTVDQNGSFDAAIQGLKYLVDAYGERSKTQLSINAVLTPPYSEKTYDQVSQFFRDLDWFPEGMQVRCNYQDADTYESTFPDGIPEIFIKNEDTGNSNHNLVPWAACHIVESTESTIQNVIAENALLKLHHRYISNTPIPVMGRNGCCIPAQRRLYVTTEGNFKVCERVGESPYFGNVIDGIDFESLYQFYLQDYEDNFAKTCNDCWCVHLCGRCYSAYCTKERIDFEKKLLSCPIEQSVCEDNLIIYHDILEKRPEWLEHLNEMKPI